MLTTPQDIEAKIMTLSGNTFLIKPPEGRNGLGIMLFDRKNAVSFFTTLAKKITALPKIKIPQNANTQARYYTQPELYWAQPDINQMIIQECISGQQDTHQGQAYESKIRIGIGIDIDILNKKNAITTTFLGGHATLPPQPIGIGSLEEQYISNYYRADYMNTAWHRALTNTEQNTLHLFSQNEFPKLYLELLLQDAKAYAQMITH